MSKHPSTQVSAGCEPQGTLSIKAVLAFFLFALSLVLSPLSAQAAKKFDHDNTGFVLNGAHQKVACETCHVRGVFKGTPKTCEGCHAKVTQITADKKSDNHMKTSDRCDDCHSEKAWRPAKTDHTSVKGECKDCHSASARIATAKPTNHVQTEAACDTCHRTTTWSITGKPAGHDQIMSGCSNCHLSIRPTTTRSGTPHPTTDNCEQCHSTSAWYPATGSGAKPSNHDTFTSGCNACHASLRPKSTGGYTHTSSLDCSECHSPTTVGWKPWKGTKPSSHSSITDGCDSCHIGKRPALMASKAPHPTDPSDCSGCHTNNAWVPAKSTAYQSAKPANHDSITTGCNGCHSGARPATTSGLAHTTSLDCSECHRTTTIGWKPWIGTKPASHDSMTNGCESCHNSKRPVNYMHSTGQHPTTGDCYNCHSVTAWYPAKTTPGTKPPGHDGFTSGCDGCHLGTRPAAFRSGGIHPTSPADCSGCHKTSGWYPSTLTPNGPKPPGHDSYSSNCSGCHNGTIAKAKGNHIPSVNNCENCHIASRSSFARPTSFSHTMTSLPCVSCHVTGLITYNMNTSKHMPILGSMTSADCGACHNTAGENGSWKSTKPTIPHAGYIDETDTYCKTCHNSGNTLAISTIQYKSGKHIGSTETCGACHTTIAWSPLKTMDHSQLSSTGTCASCHDKDKGNHFTDPSGRDCGNSACHSPTLSTWVIPAKSVRYDHLGTGTCKLCHGVGSELFKGVKFQPVGTAHFSYTAKAPALGCDGCHKPTQYTTFSNNVNYTHNALDHIPVPNHNPGSLTDSCYTNCHTKKTDTAYYSSSGIYPYSGSTFGTCGGCHGGSLVNNTTKHTNALTKINTSTGKPYCTNTSPTPVSLSAYSDCSLCHSTNDWSPPKKWCLP